MPARRQLISGTSVARGSKKPSEEIKQTSDHAAGYTRTLRPKDAFPVVKARLTALTAAHPTGTICALVLAHTPVAHPVAGGRCRRHMQRGGASMLTAIVGWIIIGIIAGWLAGMVVGGSGFGVVGDMVIGLIGAVVGGWVASLLLGAGHGANNYGFIGSLIVSFIGAVLLLLIVRAVSGGRSRRAV